MERIVALLRMWHGQKLSRTEAIKKPYDTEQTDIIHYEVMSQVLDPEDTRSLTFNVYTILIIRLLNTIYEQRTALVRSATALTVATKELTACLESLTATAVED